MAINIESIYGRDICIVNIYNIDIGIKYCDIIVIYTRAICVKSASIWDIKSKALLELRKISCCLELLKKLIYTSIDHVDYWYIQKSSFRNSHVFDIRYIILHI